MEPPPQQRRVEPGALVALRGPHLAALQHGHQPRPVPGRPVEDVPPPGADLGEDASLARAEVEEEPGQELLVGHQLLPREVGGGGPVSAGGRRRRPRLGSPAAGQQPGGLLRRRDGRSAAAAAEHVGDALHHAALGGVVLAAAKAQAVDALGELRRGALHHPLGRNGRHGSSEGASHEVIAAGRRRGELRLDTAAVTLLWPQVDTISFTLAMPNRSILTPVAGAECS